MPPCRRCVLHLRWTRHGRGFRWGATLVHTSPPLPADQHLYYEDAPTIPHADFLKIADVVARFPKSDVDLSVVTSPTLVLHGEHLPTANEETAERLISLLSNADTSVHVVPESGRASNLDNPEFFTSTLRKSLIKRIYPGMTEDVGNSADVEGST